MKLFAFSDLHRDRRQAEELVNRSTEADIVLAAGDFASIHIGLDKTIAALAAIVTPTLAVPGNNETEDALREACADWPAATVLHGQSTQIGGLSFFGLGAGIPTTPWPWSFDLTEDEAEEKLAACPEGGVLVLHSPPKGHVDKGLGSEAILRAIEAKQPALAVCGHIHECWGRESRVGETRVVNLGPDGAMFEL
jgi:uncharacterized protein